MNTYRSIALVLILAMLAFVTGCTSTTFQNGKVKLTRVQFLNKQTIKKVKITDTEATIEGYSTDANVEAANAIAQAVAGAVSEALAKQPAK